MEALPGWVVGVTGSFQDLKREVKESIEFYIECAKEDKEDYPKGLDGEYQLQYVFNIESLLCYYDGIISRASISRLTGINERQLGNYICGRSRPRKEQENKIINAFHQLGKELMSVSV